MNKEDWEVKKLGEVFELYQPKTISASDMIEDGKYPVFGANGIIGNYNQYNHKDIELLLTCRGATCGTINISQPFSWINGNAMVIHPKNADSMIFKFVYYQLLGADLSSVITGAAQPQITRKSLKVLDFHIPPLHIQTQIVAELDELNAILDKKRKQLEELDTLAQATFYDMFGDPVLNEKGWEVKKLKDIVKKIGSGSTPRGGNKSYKAEGISFIRSLNIHNGAFSDHRLAFIDEKQARLLKNVIVEENDVLLNITGASVARCCVVPIQIIPARVNQHVSIIRLKPELANYFYVERLFISKSYQYLLLSQSKSIGATREALTKSSLQELVIPIPPLPLQHQFAERIEAIEAQKELINQSIKEVQLLFDYTMDKYFN